MVNISLDSASRQLTLPNTPNETEITQLLTPLTHEQKRAISTDSNVDTPLQLTPETTPEPTTNQMLPPSLTNPNTSSKHLKKKFKTIISDHHNLTPSTQKAMHAIYEKNPSDLTPTETQFRAFLENTHGNIDPLKEALIFTSNTQGLLNDISLLYTETKERSLKNRLTRIRKKIKQQPNPEDSDNISVSSDYQTDEECLQKSSQPPLSPPNQESLSN